MAACSIRVQIADIIIRFESDFESDINELCYFFKYHQDTSAREPDCTVVLTRQASFHMPKDAKMQWQSARDGCTMPEGRIGRRRVSIPSSLDTYGIATCYMSPSLGEYYYGLMRDKSWICYQPTVHRIKYVIHQRPNKKGGSGEVETISPLSAMPLLIHVISTIHDRYLIHGAAVAIDGSARLFLGKSGSGKSTLCAELARQKVSYMGDDLALVYIKDDIPMLGALLFPAKMRIDNAVEKADVDLPNLMQTGYSQSAPLGAVYYVRQSGLPESSVERRTSADLLQQLLEASNGMMMQYNSHNWLSTMYDISERVPYSVLNYGGRTSIKASLLINN